MARLIAAPSESQPIIATRGSKIRGSQIHGIVRDRNANRRLERMRFASILMLVSTVFMLIVMGYSLYKIYTTKKVVIDAVEKVEIAAKTTVETVVREYKPKERLEVFKTVVNEFVKDLKSGKANKEGGHLSLMNGKLKITWGKDKADPESSDK